MDQMEAWKATGRRALRIARQRGWTSRRVKLALLGAGAVGVAAVASQVECVTTHQAGFEHRVIVARPADSPGADQAAREAALQARLEARRSAEQARQDALRAAEQARQAAAAARSRAGVVPAAPAPPVPPAAPAPPAPAVAPALAAAPAPPAPPVAPAS